MKIIRSKLGDLWLKIAAFFTRSQNKFTGSTITSKVVVIRSDLQGLELLIALAHELVHVDQIRDMGWWKMRWEFFKQDMKHGHQKAPLENDAFLRASEFLNQAKEIVGV